MKTETNIAIDDIVTNKESYERYVNEKERPDDTYSRNKFYVVAIPRTVLDELQEVISDDADEMTAEDFDDDGNAKHLAENETVSAFLKRFIEVKQVPSTFKVTVEFTVEAEDEDEARTEVENAINGYIDYDITDTEEED